MRQTTKAQRIEMIRTRLNAGTFERTGDKALDAQHALEQVERETGTSFGSSRVVRHIVPGTRNWVSGDAANATAVDPIEATPQSEIIADLSTRYKSAPLEHQGHTLSKPVTLTERTLVADGRIQDTVLATLLSLDGVAKTADGTIMARGTTVRTWDDIPLTLRTLATAIGNGPSDSHKSTVSVSRHSRLGSIIPANRTLQGTGSYNVPCHRPTAQKKLYRAPQADSASGVAGIRGQDWERTPQVLRTWIKQQDACRAMYSTLTLDRPAVRTCNQGPSAVPSHYSSAVIAMSRRDMARNRAEADAALAAQRAERHEACRNAPAIYPTNHPAAGIRGTIQASRLRPRAKWFIANPPVFAVTESAMTVTA
jgi:hypothetical protein